MTVITSASHVKTNVAGEINKNEIVKNKRISRTTLFVDDEG